MEEHTQRETPSARRPIRLIATDLDGTLLDSANQVPPVNRAALRAAVARGVRLALVTARKRSTALAVQRALALPCACIAHNGARSWDWEGRELRHLTLDLALAREIAAFADRHAIPLVVTVDEVNYYNPYYPIDPAQLSATDRVVAASHLALHAPPTRIIAAGHPGVEQLCQAFGDAPESLALHRYYSRGGALFSAVMTHPRATKEDAVAELCAAAGIRPAEVLALGDAEADVGLLRWAGIGVAMGNAMPEARAAADWIAPDHDAGGLAVAIERFVLADEHRQA